MKKISAVAMVFVVAAFALLLTVMAGLDGVSAQTGDYDADNDGLIEITYLEQLNAIRLDLNGDGVVDEDADADGYRDAFPGAIAQMGCPQSGCSGYELARSLDFDDAASYASGAVNTNWTSGAGWLPIGLGLGNGQYEAVFEGNDHTIANLFINRNALAGLFIRNDGHIRNVGLLDADITGWNVGGLANSNYGSITSSYATGDVSGDDFIGGLVGWNAGSITSSYSTSNASGDGCIGGLVGYNIGGSSITSSYSTGNVSGNSCIGGLAGGNLGSITLSYATGKVTGDRVVGGLVGDNDFVDGFDGGNISSSYATGSVTGVSEKVGGLIGAIYDGSISSSYSVGNVSGSKEVGGLVGGIYDGRISSSYATGSVTGSGEGSHRIGGLVGRNMFSSIGHSYAAGSVTGNNQIGGLVGENVEGSITSSYSIGSVSGNYDAGGLVGENHDLGSITNGYWNTTTSGQSEGVGKGSDDGAQGKTTAELQAPTGYTGIYAPWEFDNDYWDFGTTSNYPVLKVDFNRDGRATWQEFGNQYRGGPAPVPTRTPTPTVSPTPQPILAPTPISTPTASPTPPNIFEPTPTPISAASPTPLPILVPIHTPTPVPDQDMSNRLSALEGLVAAQQSRLNASEAAVVTLRDGLSASEATVLTLQNALVVLQNRVIALEAGIPEPIATPTLTPTPTPTPPSVRDPEPTATPPRPPADLSSRSQAIDAAVKAYIEGSVEPAKDAEIVSACRVLRTSSWDFFNVPLTTSDRDYSIVAAIFLNTEGHQEIQMYCTEMGG